MTVATLPRLGFLGVGWIGRHRMQALADAGLADVAALADPHDASLHEAALVAPRATMVPSLDELLDLDLDGVVIATPSALHAEQAVRALDAGLAVFCQKPLARTAAETETVLAAARRADRRLGVDLSYRHVDALRRAHELVHSGALGDIHTIDLVFHNAYGPDKPWFTDRALSGGGCLIDLGTHLLDLALWLTGSPQATVRSARVLAGGAPLQGDAVEDHALAEIALGRRTVARLACSWFTPAGRDCVFECTAWGTEGSVSVTNVDGSFYDFRAERREGTSSQTIAEPPDDWGGRAAGAWARSLVADPAFDPAADELGALARLVDDVYAAAGAA